jgi:hypothetical protein
MMDFELLITGAAGRSASDCGARASLGSIDGAVRNSGLNAPAW